MMPPERLMSSTWEKRTKWVKWSKSWSRMTENNSRWNNSKRRLPSKTWRMPSPTNRSKSRRWNNENKKKIKSIWSSWGSRISRLKKSKSKSKRKMLPSTICHVTEGSKSSWNSKKRKREDDMNKNYWLIFVLSSTENNLKLKKEKKKD